MNILPLSPSDAVRAADAIEAAAFVDLYDAAPSPMQRQLGLRVETVAGATALFAPGLPTTMFNRVIGVGLWQRADDAQIDALRERYRAAGVGSWWLHLSPLTEPPGLAQQLLAQGWREPARRSWTKVLRSSTPAPAAPTDLHVGPCRDAEVADTTAAIAASFGMPAPIAHWLAALHGRPRWQLFTVADGERPVGGAALFVDGDGGWLGMGAVLPTHRRRGGQLAAMAARIAAAADAGARWVATETGEPVADEPNPSLANMKRAGFVQVASRLNLEPPPA